MKRLGLSLLVSLVLIPLFAGSASAATSCRMQFQLKGWAAFYEKADGSGVITCDNGQRAAVKLEGRGGGISAGKWEISNGSGSFSGVNDIQDVFGHYASSNASAGAGGAAGVRAMTKGNVSLALSGKGRGVDLSAGFGRFTVKPQ